MPTTKAHSTVRPSATRPATRQRQSEPEHAFARAVADRIELVSLSELVSFSRRSRTHDDRQIACIMGSFEAFGLINPVIVDERRQILAGHARVEAARRLSYKTIPVVVASHLSADEKRAYVIADNRLAEKAGWDREVLALELSELSQIDLGFEIDVLGFSIGEIDLLVGESSGPSPDDDLSALPDIATATTQAGDLWTLGRHRLLCGSALEAASYATLLSDDQARMVLTDPPYNVAIDGFVGGLGAVKHREFAMAAGEMSEGEFTSFLATSLSHMTSHTVDGGLLYAFMDWRHEFELLTAARTVGLRDHNLCVWNKMSGGMGSHYRSQHELCRIFKVGTAPHLNTVELGRHGRNRSNVWDHPGLSSFGRGRDEALASHPTVKPVALLMEAIKDCTRRGDLILDPFLGSGSTLIAAERTGRWAAGIELDPLYCDAIIHRFEALTNIRAVHVPSDRFFEDVRRERSAPEIEESAERHRATLASATDDKASTARPRDRARSRPSPATPACIGSPTAHAIADSTSLSNGVRVRQRCRSA